MLIKKRTLIKAELLKEVSNYSLKATGIIPQWLSGSLIRNGPITISVDNESQEHWFDGLAMLHLFSFTNGHISYSNKFLRSDAYQMVFKKGSIHYEGFAADPCRSLFKSLFTLLFKHSDPIHNANVNITKLANEYVALTEVPLPVKFDPITLETLGVFAYQDALCKDKCWESAHPHYDSKRQETLNYLIEYGRNSFYIIYKISKDSSTRKVIAKVPVERPSYMHSFAITQNHIILTEFPLTVRPIDLITKGKAFIKNFSWDETNGTQITVIDRNRGNVTGKYNTRAFFAFHHVNAFEENNTIHIDLAAYLDASIITNEALNTDSKILKSGHYESYLTRLSLDLNHKTIKEERLSNDPLEFPRINENFDGSPYRYMYGTGFFKNPTTSKELLHSNVLYKVDTITRETKSWSSDGCMPGEPVFTTSPDSASEDDGLILSVVIDKIRKSSFLLILDAKTFKEVGRAEAPHLIPQGLHGQLYRS